MNATVKPAILRTPLAAPAAIPGAISAGLARLGGHPVRKRQAPSRELLTIQH